MTEKPLDEDELAKLNSYVQNRINGILNDDHPTSRPVSNELQNAIIDVVGDDLGSTRANPLSYAPHILIGE